MQHLLYMYRVSFYLKKFADNFWNATSSSEYELVSTYDAQNQVSAENASWRSNNEKLYENLPNQEPKDVRTRATRGLDGIPEVPWSPSVGWHWLWYS